MKFKKLLERVKDGKVDPLSPMGKSKLTGQEVAKYYKDNPRAKAAARDPQVKKAIEIALDLGGNQTMAMKEIEKLKRGLSKNREVMNALRHANESFGEDAVERAKELADLKAKHKREIDQEKRDIERTRQQTNENVRLSRPAKGQRTLTIDFSKAPNPKKAKAKTMSIAKKHNIKTGKPKKPQSKDDVEFTGSKKAMFSFGKEFNLAGQLGLLESLEESLKPHEEKISKVFKTKNPVEIKGIDRLIDMSSIGVVQSMQKQNPRGFTKTAMHLGKLKESINEETMLYRVKDIQKPELDKFKSSARLMKLKINIKQSPKGKETIIRLQGNKKQLMDFDAVARGKSSYGDPSKVEAVSPAQQAAIAIAKKKIWEIR